MMWLRPQQAAELERHARASAPHEVCGILFGRDAAVTRVVFIRNAADDPTCQYRLDEREFVRAVFAAEKDGLGLIGFFHSHPAGLAMPSETDKRLSFYPDALHLIIGLAGEPLFAAWRMDGGRAERAELLIQDTQPPELKMSHSAQMLTIVMASAAAIVCLLILSWVLLPPAPPLP